MPTLEITTMIGCPQKCTFCPQDKLVDNYPADAVRALSLDNFRLILDKVPKFVRIDFSGMSEPWANRFATMMLDHTLRDGRTVAIYTTLQGMRDPEAVIHMLNQHRAQVEHLVIHLPDKRGNMRGFRDSPEYRRAVGLFEGLPNARFMTMAEAPVVGTTDMKWQPLTRAGNLNLQNIEGQAIKLDPVYPSPVTCTFTKFYDQNVLLPNGDVVLCCMDYSIRHKLGNLLEDDYYDLFRSQGMAALFGANVSHDQHSSLCHTCSRAQPHAVAQSKQYWAEAKR